ncbi:MAG: hypothetical protein CBC42_00165 [Betaproteobacteria bacterium TMED82]|nr:MAG: hypothetical protein CBC42_00165 [Betaproteobacteria bacterium TMED82]|tara:strand:- start:1822 stop:2373 length:552 start_codon:yes stop_codon:yes gene_type:complete
MGKIRRKNITLFSLIILGMLLALCTREVYWVTKVLEANERIVADEPSGNSVFIEEKFALAIKLVSQGDFNTALSLYNSIEQLSTNEKLKIASLFNSANIYYRGGLKAIEDDNAQIAIPNFELAKLTYRKVLMLSPEHHAARYNLERVLKLSPEKNFGEKSDSTRPERGERAITTMRLQALGMP